MPLYVQETFISRTKDACFGESEVYEAWTDDLAKLFRALQKEYGRCTGPCYIDTKTGVRQIGWVFEKHMRYEDARPDSRGRYRPQDYYLRAVWVTVHTAKPTRTIEYHYFNFEERKAA